MKNITQSILEKEISRREFIGMIGLGVVSAIGISSLLKNISDSIGRSSGVHAKNDYGESLYGGRMGGTSS